MDQFNDYHKILELISGPAFLVQDGMIRACNREASACLLTAGTEILSLLTTGQEEYAQLTAGCLSLKLCVNGTSWDATVTRLEQGDLFRLEQDQTLAQIKAMSLMSAQLRYPVSSLSILASSHLSDSPAAAAFRQELSRILRILNNASNTDHYMSDPSILLEVRNVTAILQEVLEEADTLLSGVPIRLEVQLPSEAIFAPVDEHALRQAMFNLLSNAAKFSPAGSAICVHVKATKSLLRISVADQGDGVPVAERANLFSRYARQPGLEEGRQSLGLGMALVKATATLHNGTVLIDGPESGGTRVTMTLSLQAPEHQSLHSPSLAKVLQSPNEGLIMLSDVLPKELYQPNN